VVTNRWLVAGGSTVLRALIVRNAPKGARIVLRCEGRGCPIDRPRREKVRRNLAKVVLHFKGGNGNDGLFGGGGFDSFDGGPDNDNIVARDSRAEPVECASGTDTAITDDIDMRVSCEQVEGDADGDGVRRLADCDDTKPQIRPGVPDAPDDGIDQDCSGADATDLDRDKDGFSRPQDCNDADAAVKPGAKEKPGNAVDENCDREIRPFRRSPARSRTPGWSRAAERASRARGEGVPQGHGDQDALRRARMLDRRRAQARDQARAGDQPALRARRPPAAPGARLKISFARKGRVGRVLRYRIRSGALPDVDFLCRPPGSKARGC